MGYVGRQRPTLPLRADRALRGHSLPKTPADEEDRADMAVTVCRTDTMTDQTIVIDPGRYFH